MMLRHSQREREALCDHILALKGSSLETLAYDYTYWDEMVHFLHAPDRRWAAQNLDTALSTYHAFAVWVYNEKHHLAYNINEAADTKLSLLPVPLDTVTRSLEKEHFCHFFVQTSHGPLEVRGATIHATADSSRKGHVYGYFFAARRWDNAFLQELSGLTDEQVALVSARAPAEGARSSSHFTLRFARLLPAWDGKPLLRLDFSRAHKALWLLSQTQRRASLLSLAFVLGLMSLLSLCLLTWVNLPLRRITRALQMQDPTALTVLSRTNTEFGKVAHLINAFFIQQAALEREITERRQAEETIQWQAYHDFLTGLPNRALFRSRLENILAQSERRSLAILFIDLDNFKLVNDTLGHEAGDRLLVTIAERLQSSLPLPNTVARLGGDEFTILLEDVCSAQEAVTTAERVLEALCSPVKLGANEFFPSGSVGVVFTDEPSTHPEDLLRDADTAMYHAKNRGKSGYALFEPGMNAKLHERVEVEAGLRSALEHGELQVYYQPLIDLQTGYLAGAEALIRWQRPGAGLVQPGRFLSVAEETGLIVPIGYWVLEQACRQAQAWKALYQDHPFIINVNLSGRQLQQADVVERVRAILELTELAPDCLKLEITESVVMADRENATARMRALKTMGVQLALDDFGTGYSSVASLHTFPLDTVKIDRSFVERLAHYQGEATTLINAIIMMSRSLQMDVTAEGIETAEQVAHLQGLGCDLGQGYFFAKPQEAAAITEKLVRGHISYVQARAEADRDLIERLLETASPQKKAA